MEESYEERIVRSSGDRYLRDPYLCTTSRSLTPNSSPTPSSSISYTPLISVPTSHTSLRRKGCPNDLWVHANTGGTDGRQVRPQSHGSPVVSGTVLIPVPSCLLISSPCVSPDVSLSRRTLLTPRVPPSLDPGPGRHLFPFPSLVERLDGEMKHLRELTSVESEKVETGMGQKVECVGCVNGRLIVLGVWVHPNPERSGEGVRYPRGWGPRRPPRRGSLDNPIEQTRGVGPLHGRKVRAGGPKDTSLSRLCRTTYTGHPCARRRTVPLLRPPARTRRRGVEGWLGVWSRVRQVCLLPLVRTKGWEGWESGKRDGARDNLTLSSVPVPYRAVTLVYEIGRSEGSWRSRQIQLPPPFSNKKDGSSGGLQ